MWDSRELSGPGAVGAPPVAAGFRGDELRAAPTPPRVVKRGLSPSGAAGAIPLSKAPSLAHEAEGTGRGFNSGSCWSGTGCRQRAREVGRGADSLGGFLTSHINPSLSTDLRRDKEKQMVYSKEHKWTIKSDSQG